MIVKRIRFYSDGESKKKRIRLSEIKSHRGLGRSMLLGGGIMPGAIAGYVGKKAAEEADEQGLSDWEIKKAATNKGAKAGALLGGGLGLATGLSSSAAVARAAKELGIKGGTATALAGGLGAEKNTRTRLKKRNEMEERLNG